MIKKNTVNSKPIVSYMVILMVGNLAVKFFGLLREILIAKIYGTSTYTDSYIIANSIPTVIFAILGSALATTFIPMYSKIKNDEGEYRANSFTLNLVFVIFVICFFICLIGEIWTKEIVKIFAVGFKDETLNMTVSFAKILFPSVFGMALMNLCGSYLQLHEKYIPIAIVPAVGNLTIIIFLLISEYFKNVLVFVYGTLFGLVLQVLFYIPYIIKEKIFAKTNVSVLNDTYLRKMLPLIFPVLCGEAVHEINAIVDKSLVSTLEIGSVSALNYAYKITNLIHGVIVVSMITIIYPRLAKISAKGDDWLFEKTFSESISQIISVVIPIEFLVIFTRNEIIQVLFMRGEFNLESTRMTSSILICYGIGLIAIGIRELLIKVFYSKQDTKTPMVNSVICAILNIFFDFLFIKHIGYCGPAIASSMIMFIGTFILLLSAKRKNYIKKVNCKLVFIKTIIGTVIASIILVSMLSASKVICFGKMAAFIALIFTYIIFALVYVIVEKVLKNNELFKLFYR